MGWYITAYQYRFPHVLVLPSHLIVPGTCLFSPVDTHFSYSRFCDHRPDFKGMTNCEKTTIARFYPMIWLVLSRVFAIRPWAVQNLKPSGDLNPFVFLCCVRVEHFFDAMVTTRTAGCETTRRTNPIHWLIVFTLCTRQSL